MNIGFVSLGCAKNLTDAEVMAGILKNRGHKICSNPEEADVLIVNTCGFIEPAKEESIAAVLEMAEYKKKRCKVLVMTGCLAQRYHDEVLEQFPEVDAVLGTGEYSKIAEAIELAKHGDRPVFCDNIDADVEADEPRLVSGGATAYIKIAEGCDNKCTYCIIPKLRGRYRSRAPEAILKEAKKLADGGVRELIVIAQDTSRYGMDLNGDVTLASLLTELCAIEKLHWVRVLYLYPEAITDELIKVFANEKKLVPYIDMPIQHCSNAVLHRMGRHTDKEQILSIINKLKASVENLTLRTSIIVGFPGETEKQFEELLEFIRSVRFNRLGVFEYSKEEDTPAARLDGQIKKIVKKRRAGCLMEQQSKILSQLQQEKIGLTIEVLTEGYDMESFMYYGRSVSDAPEVDTTVYFASEDETKIGEFAQILILETDGYDLIGRRMF